MVWPALCSVITIFWLAEGVSIILVILVHIVFVGYVK